MHAKLNDLRSHLNNKHIAHNLIFCICKEGFLSKKIAVAHENVRLSTGMYGILSEL